MPIEQFQRYGDWFEQRAEYRKAALASLRRREGLPTSERLVGAFYQRADGFYRAPPGREVFLDTTMYPNGNDGFTAWAMGTRKGLSREEADKNWNRTPAEELPLHLRQGEREAQFQILDIAEDGKKLGDELRDIQRDAGTYEIAERVSHGAQSQMAPDFELSGTSDEEVESKLQEYLKRGPR